MASKTINEKIIAYKAHKILIFDLVAKWLLNNEMWFKIDKLNKEFMYSANNERLIIF